MSRSIKELGDTQRCPKCNEFSKMVATRVSHRLVRVIYFCEKCVKNFMEEYLIDDFVKMGNNFLIDEKKWIHNFQRKYMIAANEFVHMKDGIDGAYFSINKALVKKLGKKLICKCGEFYKMVFQGHKKRTIFFNLECLECGNSKIKIHEDEFFDLVKAGIIPPELSSTVMDILDVDSMQWDAKEAYSMGPSTVFSSDARGRLGMDDDETLDDLEGFTCSKCGAATNIEMRKFGKCGTCGAPLE